MRIEYTAANRGGASQTSDGSIPATKGPLVEDAHEVPCAKLLDLVVEQDLGTGEARREGAQGLLGAWALPCNLMRNVEKM